MNTPGEFPVTAAAEGVLLQLKVHPHARRNGLDGVLGEALKISLTAPAEQGKANHALRRFLAEIFDIPLDSIHILSGLASPRKVLRLDGVTAARAQACLRAHWAAHGRG